MVSANLPEHTPLTEMTSLTRTAGDLIRRGTGATSAEREAYETRKKAVLASWPGTDLVSRLADSRLPVMGMPNPSPMAEQGLPADSGVRGYRAPQRSYPRS